MPPDARARSEPDWPLAEPDHINPPRRPGCTLLFVMLRENIYPTYFGCQILPFMAQNSLIDRTVNWTWPQVSSMIHACRTTPKARDRVIP